MKIFNKILLSLLLSMSVISFRCFGVEKEKEASEASLTQMLKKAGQAINQRLNNITPLDCIIFVVNTSGQNFIWKALTKFVSNRPTAQAPLARWAQFGNDCLD